MPRHTEPRQRKTEALRLRTLRDLLGLTQEELAQEFQVERAALTLWESGRRSMPGPALRLLDLLEAEAGVAPARPFEIKAPSRLKRSVSSLFAVALSTVLQKWVRSDAAPGSMRHRVRAALAERLVSLLSENKGLLLKLGQMTGFVEACLPELSVALKQAPAPTSPTMPPAVVRRVIFDGLGVTADRLFDEWSDAPLAAASIGQVHRARYRGQAVVVKVQYPKIVEAIEADLANAAAMGKVGALLFPSQQHDVVLPELRERFLAECDYELEAQQQTRFREIFRDDQRLRIPQVVAAHRRVLISEYIEAQSFDHFCAAASQEQRNALGLALWEFAFVSLLGHGLLYSDLHSDNLLVQPDGRLVIVDFGQVRTIGTAYLDGWKAVARAVLARDEQGFRQSLVDFGWVRPSPDFDHPYNRKAFLTFYEPWLLEGYRFGPEYLQRLWKTTVTENPNLSHLSFTSEVVMMQPWIYGLTALLCQLEAEGNFGRIIRELIALQGRPLGPPFTFTELTAS